MLVFLAAAVLQTSTISITDAIAIGDVSKEGRRPIPDDAILRRIVDGSWTSPKAGDVVPFGGKGHTWHAVKAGKDGWIQDAALDNGYVFATVSAPRDEVMLLNAQGDSLVYVNGEPRAGDVYSNGYLNLPVNLHQGVNTFLFVCGRERLKVDLKPLERAYALQTEDATLPDVITTDRGFLWASIVTVNGMDAFARGLQITAIAPNGKSESCDEETILPCSARKLMVKLPVDGTLPLGKATYKVQLSKKGILLDEKSVELTVKDPLATQKRTFVSGIDGSVQYYSVVPAAKPSGRNALVFTVHGAGVEATSQAAAYQQKDWATIVAPTNRRPYGFDWEDIGLEDFKEVEAIAKQTYPHDPERVDLTGHSMGGHGTWFIGTMLPDQFASIAPSAGWISWWSYAGGWNPEYGLETEKLLRRSMNSMDVLGRVTNTLLENVYILHGDADDNVPVEQARTMRAELQKIGHPSIHYHEQPGAGHWWGNQCVDWPPIFDMIKDSRLDEDPMSIDFTTQDVNKASKCHWITVEGQEKTLEPSRVQAERNADGSAVTITTSNVSLLRLDTHGLDVSVTIDGQKLAVTKPYGLPNSSVRPTEVSLCKCSGSWVTTGVGSDGPWPGNFKNIFQKRFLFVFGTKGTAEENAWSMNAARYFAESFMYRGNGAVDVIPDFQYGEYVKGDYPYRNVIVFGNADTNQTWGRLMSEASVQVHRGFARVRGKEFRGTDIGGLVSDYSLGIHVAAVTGTGIQGMRSTDRLGLFTSGVAYPDWILTKPDAPAGILADGFDNPENWKFDPANTAFAVSK